MKTMKRSRHTSASGSLKRPAFTQEAMRLAAKKVKVVLDGQEADEVLHRERVSTYSPKIWRIACAGLWLRKFIDSSSGKTQAS